MKSNVQVQPVELVEVPPNFSLYKEESSSTEPEADVLTDLGLDSDSNDNEATAPSSAVHKRVLNVFNESRHPIVIRGIDIGDCKRWTPEYLTSVNKSQKVKIHRSKTRQLDFRSKNFVYDTIEFSDLIEHCSRDMSQEDSAERDYLYLRSLGFDPRGKEVADISVQFPELFADLKIPKLYPAKSFFSSVFRITSPNLQLWTHYDTCDNILVQVRGRKRVVLFPPWEALNLYLDGDKSLILDIDNPDLKTFPKFETVQRFETILEEGDILYIPALWFHNVVALNFSISVNVFWKNLSPSLYDNKDTYGNRDLIPAQLGFRTLEKSIAQLKQLPKEYEDFYLRRMIISIQQRLEVLAHNQ